MLDLMATASDSALTAQTRLLSFAWSEMEGFVPEDAKGLVGKLYETMAV